MVALEKSCSSWERGAGQPVDSIISVSLRPRAFMCRKILNWKFIAAPVHKDKTRDLQLLFLYSRAICVSGNWSYEQNCAVPRKNPSLILAQEACITCHSRYAVINVRKANCLEKHRPARRPRRIRRPPFLQSGCFSLSIKLSAKLPSFVSCAALKCFIDYNNKNVMIFSLIHKSIKNERSRHPRKRHRKNIVVSDCSCFFIFFFFFVRDKWL